MISQKTSRRVFGLVSAIALGALITAPAHAIPKLQIYIEGATYDTVTETWILDWDPMAGEKLRLWTIGNISGGGGAHGGGAAGGAGLTFGGVSILIAAGVALETMKQVDSQLMMRNYEGFLR